MEELTTVQRVAVWALPVLFAITVHEAAHGWVARKLGDPTAMMLGRLTLNPIKHIDPIGTILIPAVMILLPGPYLFGWAKPVPVTWENLKNPKRDMALVAIAGPAVNLIMAIIWALVIRLCFTVASTPDPIFMFIIYVGVAGIYINIILMILNLLPIPPLDGGRVLAGLLPGPWAWKLSRVEPYGLPILITLLVLGVLGAVLGPLIKLSMVVFSVLAGITPQLFERLLYTLMS